MMRLPELLDAQMAPAAILHPEALRLTMTLAPLSRATMVLSPGEPTVRVGDWVRLDSPQGMAGIFRATVVEENCRTGQRTVLLEHGFGELADSVLADSTSGDQPQTMPADELLGMLLSHSSRWVLDRCEYTEAAGQAREGANLLSEVLRVSEALEQSRWVFDQRTLPWRASLVRMDETEDARSEMRLSRSIADMRVTLDRSEMYTRIYPRGADGLTIAEVNGGMPYLEENADVWGVAACVDVDLDETDAASLKRHAEARLHAHAMPQMSVEIDGADLSRETGEPLDALVLGRICRVPLPEKHTVVTQRITSLTWPDLVRDPDRVQVTLANRRTQLSAMTGRALEKQQAQLIRVAQIGDRRYAGLRSVVQQQGTAIDGLGGRILTAETGITQNAYEIDLWAKKTTAYGERIVQAEAELVIQAEQISSRVKLDEFESYITQTAQAISLKADQIQLDALETTVEGMLHGSELLLAGDLSCRDVSCNDFAAEGGGYFSGHVTANSGLAVSGSLTVDGNAVATRSWVNDKAVFGGAWHYHTFTNTAGNNVGCYFWTKNG